MWLRLTLVPSHLYQPQTLGLSSTVFRGRDALMNEEHLRRHYLSPGSEAEDAKQHKPGEDSSVTRQLPWEKQGRERHPRDWRRLQRAGKRRERGRGAARDGAGVPRPRPAAREPDQTLLRAAGPQRRRPGTPPGAHAPRQRRRDLPGTALVLLSPGAARRALRGEAAPGRALPEARGCPGRPGPPVPSRPQNWEEKERRDGNRRPYQQEGVRPASLLSLWEAKTL